MKKSFKLFLCVVLCGLFLAVPSGIAQKQCFAEEEISSKTTNEIKLAQTAGLSSQEKTDFAPLGENKQEMSGSSWVPQKNGGYNIDDEILFAGSVEGLNTNKLYMKVWIYFPYFLTNDLVITLSDETNTNSIEWSLETSRGAQGELAGFSALLKKNYQNDFPGSIDLKFYSEDNVPFGWNLIVLPFSKGSKTGEVVSAGELVVNTLHIKQNELMQSAEQLYVHSIQFGSSEQTNIFVDKSQEFVRVEFSQDLKSLVNGEHYINEYFNLPEIAYSEENTKGIFKAVRFGETNVLKEEGFSQYFSLKINDVNYEYGSKFHIQNVENTIKFMVKNPLDSKPAVLVGLVVLKASSYGTGVWFVSDELNMEVGHTQKISYKIHKAFTGATITFSSLDNSVAEIIDVDSEHQTVTIRAKKAGEVNIRIKVQDPILYGYSPDGTTIVEEDGLINDRLLVKVSVVKDTSKPVKIVLWVAFGGVVVYLGYLLVAWYKKSRNFEVK